MRTKRTATKRQRDLALDADIAATIYDTWAPVFRVLAVKRDDTYRFKGRLVDLNEALQNAARYAVDGPSAIIVEDFEGART